MQLSLQRRNHNDEATVGTLFVDGCMVCHTLEDQPQANGKVYGETRIPAGTYNIIPRHHGRFYNSYNARWGHPFVLELVGVPGFTDILIHTGNTDDHTEGCILVGLSLNGFTIGKSRDAYVKLFNMVKEAVQSHNCTITIYDEA